MDSTRRATEGVSQKGGYTGRRCTELTVRNLRTAISKLETTADEWKQNGGNN